MKARYSEEYLRSTWATLIQETPDGDYMNFEDELNYRMSVYKELPTEAFKAHKLYLWYNYNTSN